MGNKSVFLGVLSFATLYSLQSFAGTTLAQLTENNTSASSSFTGIDNGDTAPGNVSQMPIRKYIPNYEGVILAHWMPWWDNGYHAKSDGVNVFYSTEDTTQIDNTINDMIRRGYDGVLVAESNSGGVMTASTLAMSKELTRLDKSGSSSFSASTYQNFKFVISENHLDKFSTVKEQEDALDSDMSYAKENYFTMKNYLMRGNQPVVYVFDNANVNWSTIKTSGSPFWVLDGASHAEKDQGGFFWFGGLNENTSYSSDTTINGSGHLMSFFESAVKTASSIYSGTFYKGFNDIKVDSIKGWGLDRYVDQACGLTIVNGLAAINKAMASSHSGVPYLQNATWNDYEEGTELETGVDNCFSTSVSYSSSKKAVTFDPKFSSPYAKSISDKKTFVGEGSEATVDHYEIYASSNVGVSNAANVNMTLISTVETSDSGSYTVSLNGLKSGTYDIYVRMVGKSHILNRMSSPIKVSL